MSQPKIIYKKAFLNTSSILFVLKIFKKFEYIFLLVFSVAYHLLYASSLDVFYYMYCMKDLSSVYNTKALF